MSWPIKKLAEVCARWFSGIWGADPFNNSNVFIVRVSDIEDDGIIDYDNLPLRFVNPNQINKYKLQTCDIVVVKSSGSKKKVISGKAGLFIEQKGKQVLASNFVLALRPNTTMILPKWLLYYLNGQNAKSYVLDIIGITTYPNLKPIQYLKMPIPLPPLEIQKKIVAKIEELFSKIDKTIELRQKVLQETEQIFPSALNQVFSEAEKKWGTKKLGNIIELNYGKGISKEDRKEDGKYSIYGANGELGRTDKYLVEGEAIIVGRKGTAGAVNRVSGRFWPADVTYYILANNNINIDFLYFGLEKIDLKLLANGIKPGINRNKVYKLEIPLPPLPEQKKIVDYLDALREKVDKLKQLQQEQLAEFKELKNSILDKAFKGELI